MISIKHYKIMNILSDYLSQTLREYLFPLQENKFLAAFFWAYISVAKNIVKDNPVKNSGIFPIEHGC